MKAPQGIRYAHTNVIARDWRSLARFYEEVLGCVPVSSERDHHGPLTDALVGIPNVRVTGRHLRVPGHGENGPTLEFFSYHEQPPNLPPQINRPGFAHLAFEVPDLAATRAQFHQRGGGDYGEQITLDIPGAGRLTLIYLTDPEGNIVELQHWHGPDDQAKS